jgi:hypothetical protein
MRGTLAAVVAPPDGTSVWSCVQARPHRARRSNRLDAAANYLWLRRREHASRPRHIERLLRVPAAKLVRIHRSTLVNLRSIARIEPRGSGDANVILRDGTELGEPHVRARAASAFALTAAR